MLIGLNGRKQAGKDTVYARTARKLEGVMTVERASFADLLYRSAAASLGVTVAELQEWKSNPLIQVEVIEYASERDAEKRDGNFGWIASGHSVREYLQKYGTEAHREVFGTDFWVEQLDLEHAGRLVMVTDVRFPNEAEAVRRAGGYVVQVVGPPEVEHTGDGHASEAPLPEHLITAHLNNHVRHDDFRTLDGQIDTLLRYLNGGGSL